MDRDSVRLVIGGYEFTEFQSLEIVSDLYAPVGSFRFELGQRLTAISGQTCAVWINGKLELTGIIAPVKESQDKSSHTWSVSGTSLVGLIERHYITSWTTPPSTLKGAAEKYLSQIPYIQNVPWKIQGEDRSTSHARVDVGDTVFQLLNEMAQNRGKLFWSEPDGTLVFGPAAGKGLPTFQIGSKVERRSKTDDTSKLHSEIWVVSDSEEGGHQTHKVSNPSVALHSPFVAAYNGADPSGMLKQANEYRRQEKMAALQLEYVVAGFGQNGKNWRINERAQVDDETFGIQDTFLITRRVFHRDRNGGSTTTLTLAPILAEDVFKAYPKPKRKDAF